MLFSTRTTYGLRAMASLAAGWGKESISLSSISREENISLGYLERIFTHLKKAGLVKASRGAKGGYRLTRPPRNIFIYDIIKALEGEISPFHCVREKGEIKCPGKDKCDATKVLVKVQLAVEKVLRAIKLSDLNKPHVSRVKK